MSSVRQRVVTGAPAGLLIAVVLRVFYSALAAAATPFLRLDPAVIRTNDWTEHLIERSDGLSYMLVGVWQRFDTLWYVHIATQGYDHAKAVVFYPLYPILIRAVSLVIPWPLVSALLLATLAACFWFWGIEKLLSIDFEARQVRRIIVLAAVWPASFIFFCGYPDSLVGAFTVWSLFFARKQRWGTAGLLGLAAGLTKAVGSLVLVPLGILAWRQRTRSAWWALVAGLGPLFYSGYLLWRGLPLPSEAYPLYWRTHVAMPWTTLASVADALGRSYSFGLRLNLLAVAIATALVLMRGVRLEYRLYALSCVALFLAKETNPLLQSSVRYVAIVFPAYIGMNRLLDDRARYAVGLAALAAANLFLLWQFLEWSLLV